MNTINIEQHQLEMVDLLYGVMLGYIIHEELELFEPEDYRRWLPDTNRYNEEIP